MASTRGRERSYRLRHELKTFKMDKRQAPFNVRKHEMRNQRLQVPWMPEASNDLEQERQAFLLDVLLSPGLTGRAVAFGIIWSPQTPWASGSSIEPFAHIFDRFVAGHWTVSISHELGPDRLSGWLFEPI